MLQPQVNNMEEMYIEFEGKLRMGIRTEDGVLSEKFIGNVSDTPDMLEEVYDDEFEDMIDDGEE